MKSRIRPVLTAFRGAATAALIGGVAVAAVSSSAHASTGPRDADTTANSRIVNVPKSSVSLKLWEQFDEGGGPRPYYSISFDGESFSEPRATSYVLKLRHGDFDPLAPAPAPAIEPGFEAKSPKRLQRT